jgi:hypothetical protein
MDSGFLLRIPQGLSLQSLPRFEGGVRTAEVYASGSVRNKMMVAGYLETGL